MKLRFAVVVLMSLWHGAHADELPDDAAAREQIKQQRAAVEAQHLQQEEACRHQFVVTTCLDKARVEKQAALRVLRSQELALDDAQRRQRAAEQAQRVAEKTQAAKERERAASSPPAASPSVRQPAAPREAVNPPTSHAQQPDRHVQEQARREEFEARQKEMQAHRKAVEDRNAERAKHKPPTPLPTPAPLSGSGAVPQ